jgi:CPA1 family monovalent cation:H+ antiporter
MSLFDIASLLVGLAAVFAYLNHRWLHLPPAIGLMLIALCMSLGIIVLDRLGLEGLDAHADAVLAQIDFNETLIHGMLSFLLFAGALHADLEALAKQKWVILILASFGVVLSTFLVGIAAWGVFSAVGLAIPFIYCLLFGALISPTDPIAVLGILKTAGAPPSLETKIMGESLFNDGIGVVLFIVLAGIAAGGGEIQPGQVGLLFVEEALGGILFGLAIGAVGYWMLKSMDSYEVEVLITVALVMGGYALAAALHVSGPIAMVVAGLLIGNHGRRLAMSERTREHLDNFWALMDEMLNAILFVLIGLEVLVLSFQAAYLLASLVLVVAVLGARLISVGLPIGLMRRVRGFSPGAVWVMTWGGLRGGISVALALSLPQTPERPAIVFVTYTIVVFSILVQGLTVAPLIRRVSRQAADSR